VAIVIEVVLGVGFTIGLGVGLGVGVGVGVVGLGLGVGVTGCVTIKGANVLWWVVSSSAITLFGPNAASKGIVMEVVKVPSSATVGFARTTSELPKRISTIVFGGHPLPVTVTTVPAGAEVMTCPLTLSVIVPEGTCTCVCITEFVSASGFASTTATVLINPTRLTSKTTSVCVKRPFIIVSLSEAFCKGSPDPVSLNCADKRDILYCLRFSYREAQHEKLRL
jgi:hypothetical protein